MSPSEFDLRAALHDGEGEGVDVDRVVAGARAQRARHRSWLLSAAAAVVVAGVAAGSAVIWGSGGGGGHPRAGMAGQPNSSSTATPARPGGHVQGAANGPQPSSSAAPGAANGTAASAATVACPDRVPNYPPKGDGTGPLFSKPVSTLVVCGYGTPAQATAGTPVRAARLVLTADRAQRLAASLQRGLKTEPSCAHTSATNARIFAFLGLARDGSSAGTVTATLGSCDKVSNGSNARWDWQPPADVKPVLLALTPIHGTIIGSAHPGIMHGSPIHS